MVTGQGVSAIPAGAGSFAVLCVDDLLIVVPQDRVVALEPVVAVEAATDDANAIGSIETEGRRWPVFCIDSTLERVDAMPGSRTICAVLRGTKGRSFGVLCDLAGNAEPSEVHVVPMPSCMRHEVSPVESLAVYADRVGSVLSPVLLSQHLEHLIQCAGS